MIAKLTFLSVTLNNIVAPEKLQFFKLFVISVWLYLFNLDLYLWQLQMQEKKFCGEIRILLTHYLNMSQTMSMGMLRGNITKKSDAHGLVSVDLNKVDRVHEMLVKKGLTQA